MIQVIRGPKPPILQRNEASWTRHLLNALQKWKRGEGTKPKVIKYNHPQIKNALKRDFHGKCCYCESKVLHVDYGDIEHFRPKILYPSLAYKWENLLLSCGRCNKEYKRDQFPVMGNGGPYLINPCNEDPTQFIRFSINGRAFARRGNPRGVKTIELTGLNRDELHQYRRDRLDKLLALKAVLEKDLQEGANPNDPKVLRIDRILQDAIKDESEYAAMMRQHLL